MRLIAAALISIVLTWSLLGLDLWRMHGERIAQANEQAGSLAIAIEQRVTRTLRITDQALLLMRGEILRQRAWKDPETLHRIFRGSAPHLDEIVTVSFIDANGISLAQSNPAVPAGRNYAASDLYRHHLSVGSDEPYVEKPIVGPASGLRIFNVSRALRDSHGELLGVVSASIRTDILSQEFASLRIGKNGSLGLHHLPTYLVSARQPDYEETFARSLMHRDLQDALAKAPHGFFEGAISSDNVQRFFAYRSLEGLPLAVTVGIARSDIGDRLYDDLVGYISLLAVLTLAIAGGAVAILRAHRREITLRQHLAEKDALLRAFFDAVPAGMCTLDREMRYRTINPVMARINGKPQEIYVGNTVREVHPTLLGRLAPIHHEVFTSGREFRDIDFVGEVAGQPGTIGYWQASFFPIRDSASRVVAMGCFVVEVTAQKQTEEALRRNEMLLGSVLNLLPVGVWITDCDGRIVRSNPAGEKIRGGRHPELASASTSRVWSGDGGAPLTIEQSPLFRAIHQGETVTGEMVEIECPDGSRKFILDSAMPLRDSRGELLGAIAVNEDVTRMRNAQEEMRIARDFFERTFDAAPVGMAVANIEGRYIKVNRAMTDFIGYSADELQSMNYLDITHPEDVETNRSMRKSLLAGEYDSHLVEKRYIRKDGSTVWATLVVSLVRDPAGQPLYTIGQMLDISRQKAAEQALRASAVRFRAIFDNANTGIVATDEHDGVGYFNEAFRKMLDRTGETLRRLTLADFTHPDDLQRERRLLDEIRTGERENYRLEKRYLRPDGSILWVDSSVSPIRDQDRRIVSFVGVVYDVTERKEAELALSDSRQKLRALAAHQMRMLEEDRKHVAREIHDELGQLLTALKMDLSLLRMGTADKPELQDRLAGMREIVEHTIDVVRHVASNLRPSALDLGLLPAIEWLADDFSARWEIPCEFDAGEGGEFVLDDTMSTAVFRVIQESLTNIARHAGAQRVSIRLRHDPGHLEVTVGDDGQGFDLEAVTRKKTFGLFGMRERVLAVGGRLDIDTRPGAGTRILISLPLGEETGA